ncbi:MAG: glycosyltransferase family 4 protein [Candidatus Hydrogenedentes bacterium]|nr:glycosyltransferase family 4 protein [Candidatus Hydrogenedentota bacterium]
MNVLHLFSNAKFTGPAELALNLCVTLRSLGVGVDLAFPALPTGRAHTLLDTARARGIEPILDLRLSKHENPVVNWLDARALARFLDRSPYDLIHCHLDNDHRIALAATRVRGIPVVRSSYEGLGLSKPRRHRPLLRRTARLFQPSQRALRHDHETYGYPLGSMQVVSGAIDVARFDPAREVPDGRGKLGIPAGAFVIGIVARMQTHRRYEDFFSAMRLLTDAGVDAHAIVVGRGTNQESVGKVPARRIGLGDRVHFPGYVSGDDYVGVLGAFDTKVFLVPGSDGTCRAVREAMAMGKPAVVSERGMLPEIVADGVDGFVCDGSPEALYRALSALATDRPRRERMSRAARNKAVSTFSLEAQARAVLTGYEAVLEERRA